MLSQKCKYAIRSVLYLSMHSSEECKINAVKVSKDLNLPEAFTSKILQQLAAAKIISSSKGPGSGFYLTKENKKKKIFDVVKCIDGTDVFKKCGLGLNVCSDKKPCPMHNDFVKIRNIFSEAISNTTIEALTEKVVKQKLNLVR